LKSRTTRAWWRCGGTGALWQRSFHNRGLREVADIDRVIVYVLDNSVRADLVDEWEQNPYTGGSAVSDGTDCPTKSS
jgi:hypothetical protein